MLHKILEKKVLNQKLLQALLQLLLFLRAIQQYLLNPMSKAIVSGGYGPKDTIKVDVAGEDQITFERIPAPDEEETEEPLKGLPQQ